MPISIKKTAFPIHLQQDKFLSNRLDQDNYGEEEEYNNNNNIIRISYKVKWIYKK